MKRIHLLQIKGVCIMYANENGMKVDMSDDETFQARGEGSILNVPYQHIYDQVQNGWQIIETLQNETCHDEAFYGETWQDETARPEIENMDYGDTPQDENN